MTKLRAATHSGHVALESDIRISSLFRTVQGLANLLGRWYGFLVPFEAAVARVPGLHEIMGNRGRLSLLASDLRWHGVNASRLELNQSPEYQDAPSALGALYVIEGSTLGGRLLATRIEQELGLRAGCGYSFLRGYGEENGRMWRELSVHVNRLTEDESERAALTAQETFSRIHCWLAGA